MSAPATTPWRELPPLECGEYLIEFVGDCFPKGDINNVTHALVDVVNGDGEMVVLRNGQIFHFSDFPRHKWAKIINAPTQ